MTPEEKLAHIEELLNVRRAATEELYQLLGEAAPAAKQEPQVEREKGKLPVAGRRYNQPGHANAPQKKGCAECGSISRHKGTCSQAGGGSPGTKRSNGRTIHDAPGRLTEQEYNDVCAALGDGLTREEVRFSYPHVTVSEIIKTSESDSYSDYLSK